MSIWTPARVADDLRTGRLTEASKARYVVLAVVVNSIVGTSSLRDVRSEADMITLLMCLCIALIGIWMAFRANAAGDGHAFVERYVCIGVPLWIYLGIIYVAAYYLIYALLAPRRVFSVASYPLFAAPYMRSLGVWLTVAFVVGIRRYVARAARPLPRPQPE